MEVARGCAPVFLITRERFVLPGGAQLTTNCSPHYVQCVAGPRPAGKALVKVALKSSRHPDSERETYKPHY